MAGCNRQTRTVNQEAAIINGSKVFMTFGDPQLMPVMVREGYENLLVYPAVASADQFASPPKSRQNVTRLKNGVVYFCQMVEAKDPVAYTFILVDRDPEA